MKPRTFAILLGLVAIVTGVILMVLPVTVTVTAPNIFDRSIISTTEYTCNGLIAAPVLAQAQATLLCDDAEGTRSMWSWVLIGIGIVLIAGGALVKPNVPTPTPGIA